MSEFIANKNLMLFIWHFCLWDNNTRLGYKLLSKREVVQGRIILFWIKNYPIFLVYDVLLLLLFEDFLKIKMLLDVFHWLPAPMFSKLGLNFFVLLNKIRQKILFLLVIFFENFPMIFFIGVGVYTFIFSSQLDIQKLYHTSAFHSLTMRQVYWFYSHVCIVQKRTDKIL